MIRMHERLLDHDLILRHVNVLSVSLLCFFSSHVQEIEFDYAYHGKMTQQEFTNKIQEWCGRFEALFKTQARAQNHICSQVRTSFHTNLNMLFSVMFTLTTT